MIKVSFAELHSPMFLAGVNLSTKLDPQQRRDLVLAYDRVEKELHVTLGGKTACVPSSSLVHYVPANAEQAVAPVITQHKAQKHPVNAQISDPSRDVQNPVRK